MKVNEMANVGRKSRMCAFVDIQEEREGMKWKTWRWWMNVCKDPKQKEGMKDLEVECKDLEGMEYKDLEWTWNMKDGNIWV